MSTAALLHKRRAELQRFSADEIQQRGALHITKESGMVIGRTLPGRA
jgi:hypothetical protein